MCNGALSVGATKYTVRVSAYEARAGHMSSATVVQGHYKEQQRQVHPPPPAPHRACRMASLHPPTKCRRELTGLHTATRESNCTLSTLAAASSSPSPCPSITDARRCRVLLPEGIPRVLNSNSMGPESLSPTSTLGGGEKRGARLVSFLTETAQYVS